MIIKILKLPPDKNRHRKEHTAEYKINNNIFNQICKDTDLYSYIKQHKSKKDDKGTFHAR